MNRWFSGILIALFLILAVISIFLGKQIKSLDLSQSTSKSTVNPTQPAQGTSTIPAFSDIATNLHVPWALAFLPNKDILFTERSGKVRLIEHKGEVKGEPVAVMKSEPIATISEVKEIGEGGLLGIAVHPNFASNHFVYFYYTYSSTNNNTRNRVVRFTFDGNSLKDSQTIVDNIPGNSNHNGGRIKFGPDNYLYITTGDSEEPSLAQNTSSLAGKILRVTDEGKPARGNPFNNPIYSYGHRNPQGITWDDKGQLLATEHGRSGIQSGFDELNLIASGKNYGWPTIQGDEKKDGMVTPVLHSGGSTTWAPSGTAFFKGSIFFSALRGQGLYEAVLSGTSVSELKKHFANEFGRIREVVAGPDGFLYISTSNEDGRGNPKANDDRIIRVDPAQL